MIEKQAILKEDVDQVCNITYYFRVLSASELHDLQVLHDTYRLNRRVTEADEILNKKCIIKFGFSIINIIAFGDTEMSKDLANKIIEYCPNCGTERISAYKCFVNPAWKKDAENHLIIHENGQCSWNCLMEMFHKPKFGVIYKSIKLLT
jgi:hypothetical protein